MAPEDMKTRPCPWLFLYRVYPHMDGAFYHIWMAQKDYQKSRIPLLRVTVTGLSSYNLDSSSAKNSMLSKTPKCCQEKVSAEKWNCFQLVFFPEFLLSLCFPPSSCIYHPAWVQKCHDLSRGHKLSSSKCRRQLLLQFMCVSQSWTAEKTKTSIK